MAALLLTENFVCSVFGGNIDLLMVAMFRCCKVNFWSVMPILYDTVTIFV